MSNRINSFNSWIDKKDLDIVELSIPKVSTVPADLAKSKNKVANDQVEEIDFNAIKLDNKTGQDNLETIVQNNHLTTETSINNLKTKVDGIDLTKYVKKTDYDTKVGNLELKMPDVSGLLPINTFNSKVSELETKIKTAESKPNISNLATKTEVSNVENKIPDSKAFVKKTDYATEISSIKNDYITNAALTSQLNDLKLQHIADEDKKVDDKVTKNSTNILGFQSRLKQKEDTLIDSEREASFFRGSYYYNQNSYFLFESRSKSFSKSGGSISSWKSTGIHNDSNNVFCKQF